jgi:hypothetical protein
MKTPVKKRTRLQIVQSLTRPEPARAPAASTRKRSIRKHYTLGSPAREQVGSMATATFGARRLHPAARPLSVGVGAALATGTALLVSGVESFLVIAAVPLVCAVAYGTMSGVIGSIAQRQAKEELDLAGAFDRLVETSAAGLPPATIECLKQIKLHLVRLLGELRELQECGALSHDDVHFIRQSVVRYVPDAISPFMALSPERRAQDASQSPSPAGILDEQLDLICAKLQSLAASADDAHLENLQRNKTFIERRIR